MPCIKAVDMNDSDEGEEMEQEDDPSDKSSNVDSDSSDNSGSDEDDSSEMDEEVCDKRRTDCLLDMADLERQFTLLKEQLYRERTTQVDTKLEEVRIGNATEYLQPLQELQDMMKIRTEVAGVLRKLRITNIMNKHEAEKIASQQNYESEKIILRDAIQSDLEDKIRRLEEDRNSIDFTSDMWNEQVNHKKNRRKTDPMNLDKRKKPVTVSGPYIVYMLKEEDILEDWAVIKKCKFR